MPCFNIQTLQIIINAFNVSYEHWKIISGNFAAFYLTSTGEIIPCIYRLWSRFMASMLLVPALIIKISKIINNIVTWGTSKVVSLIIFIINTIFEEGCHILDLQIVR